jgi:hypothetical protein
LLLVARLLGLGLPLHQARRCLVGAGAGAGADARRRPPAAPQRYYGPAVGKGRQAAKNEIEKLKLGEMTCKQAVMEAARILHKVRRGAAPAPPVCCVVAGGDAGASRFPLLASAREKRAVCPRALGLTGAAALPAGGWLAFLAPRWPPGLLARTPAGCLRCMGMLHLGPHHLTPSHHSTTTTTLQIHEEDGKQFELELTWLCEESGWQHGRVPKELQEEAERAAKAALEDSDMDDD